MTEIRSRRERGFTMIEALVAMFVTAVGVLAVVGTQIRTLADTQTSVRRSQAVRLIEDFSERLRANPNALVNLVDYQSSFDADDDAAPKADCTASSCKRAELASYNLWAWKQTIKSSLGPGAQASIFLAPGEAGTFAEGDRRQLGVIIAWPQNERAGADDDFKSAIDAVTNAGGAAAASKCPENFTCQLQYIPVPARCAPYFAGGSGDAKYYCAGAINGDTDGAAD